MTRKEQNAWGSKPARLKENEKSYQVTSKTIYGVQQPGEKLFIVFWQRIANSGYYLIWAKDEKEAHTMIGYNPKFVKMTIVQIDPQNMPVEIGRAN